MRTHSSCAGLLPLSKWICAAMPRWPAPMPFGKKGISRRAGRNAFDYIVELESEDAVRALRPNHSLLKKIPVRGVIVTSRGADYDFISRFFAPGSGIDEDPVTGSAHCCLGPFWRSRLNKSEFVAYQASARGGVVRVRLEGGRVLLSGQAVTVLRGTLMA